MRLDHSRAAFRHLGVLARLVERPERRPDLPADGLVRLPGSGAERDDRRLGLLGERRSLHAGRGEDERAGGRIDPLAVELEHGAPLQDEVELLVPVRLVLVVLVDDPVARAAAGPRVDAERR